MRGPVIYPLSIISINEKHDWYLVSRGRCVFFWIGTTKRLGFGAIYLFTFLFSFVNTFLFLKIFRSASFIELCCVCIAQFPLVHDRFSAVGKKKIRSHNVQHCETLRLDNKKLFCSEVTRSVGYGSALFIFFYNQKLSQQVKSCGHTTFFCTTEGEGSWRRFRHRTHACSSRGIDRRIAQNCLRMSESGKKKGWAHRCPRVERRW